MTKTEKKIKDRKVTLTDGSKVSLTSLVGEKGLILYFYPKDNTSGCTTEACSFRDALPALQKKGWNVVGVSTDSVSSHQKFTEKHSLNFPLIADTEQTLCNAFGVWKEKKLYGKVYMGIVRTTFRLDPTLKIIEVYNKVKVQEHAEEILHDIQTT